MDRRDCLRTLTAAAMALPGATAAHSGKGRFRSAICAYSFRDQIKAGSMSYGDLIRMAADLGADGVDLTAYWLRDTSDETLFPLKKLAYRSAVSIYTIGIGARLSQPTPELQAAEVETGRKWVDVAQRLGAGHVRVFGGAVPKGATEEQAVVLAVETLKRWRDEAGEKGLTPSGGEDARVT